MSEEIVSLFVNAIVEHKWLLLLGYLLAEYFYTFFYSSAKKIPGPFYSRFTNLVNIYKNFTCENIQYSNQLHKKYGDVVRLGPNIISVASPEAFNLLLRELDMPKSPIYENFGVDNALSSFSMTNKEQHHQRRRIVSQAFSVKALRSVEPIILETGVQKMFEFIERKREQPIDVGEMFHCATLDIIGKVAFGASFQFLEESNPCPEKDQIKEAIELDFSQSFLFISFPWLKELSFLPVSQKRIWSTNTLISFAERLRDTRLEQQGSKSQSNDILDLILSAADPSTGQKLSMKEVTVETLTFLEAGSETSSNTMTWMIYLLLKHPDILFRVQDEIRGIIPGKEFLNNEVIRDHLPYFNATFNECMRLMPVGGGGSLRTLDRDVQLGGHHLKKGTEVSFSIFNLHHNPKVWPSPQEFNPDRFLPPLTNSPEDLKNRFEPFSCGMRNCVGREFAKMEMRILLANLIRFYNFHFTTKNLNVKPVSRLTLVPDSPIMVNFKIV